jgi:hypothetical protein
VRSAGTQLLPRFAAVLRETDDGDDAEIDDAARVRQALVGSRVGSPEPATCTLKWNATTPQEQRGGACIGSFSRAI